MAGSINKKALVDVLQEARTRSDAPPHETLLKYQHLYRGGSINSDGIAAVRIAEAMAHDPVISLYADGFVIAGGIQVPIQITDWAMWLWQRFKADVRRIPETAIEKLDALIARNSAPAFTYLALSDIPITYEMELGTDLRLVQPSTLSRSETYKAILVQRGRSGVFGEPSAILVQRHEVRPVLLSSHEHASGGLGLAQRLADAEQSRHALLEDVKNCLGLIGPCAPGAIALWTELDPEEVPHPDVYGWYDQADRHYFPVPPLGEFEEERAAGLIQRFLQWNPTKRFHLRITLQRLNTALRQAELVDQAIDLGISLEALLLHEIDKPEGLRYRFALRGASFHAEPGPQRMDCFYQLREIYDLRSAAVHKGQLPKDTVKPATLPKVPTQLFLQNSARLASALIARVIENGTLPDWESVILHGGIEPVSGSE